jgi:hypothetical protein
VGEDLLRAQGDRHGFLGRQAEGLVHGVGVQALAPAEHAGHRLVRHADDVVQRLLLGERASGGLHVGLHPPRALVLRAVAVLHHAGPDATGRAQLADLLEELVVRVEEEREARREEIDIHAALQARLDVLHAVAQREGEFLHRGGAGLADVVAGDRHAVPARHRLTLELDGVDDELDRRLGRIDELVLGVELLEDVVLERAAEFVPVEAALPAHRQVHRPDDRGRAVDGLADGDLVERDVGVEPVHVLDGVDGDAALADLAGERGSSLSRPMRVGRSKAVERPVLALVPLVVWRSRAGT